MNGVRHLVDVSMIVALLTAIGLLVRARSQNKRDRAEGGKADADAAAVISETALELLAPLRAELKAAHEEVSALRDEVRDVRAENAAYHRLYGPLPAP